MNAIFKTFAKLADVAKLHKSGAKSEPTTCAEEQVNHYRSPKDAVNKGEKNLACISLLLPVAMTFLCKRYQLFKKYIRYEVLDNFCVAYMRFCLKNGGRYQRSVRNPKQSRPAITVLSAVALTLRRDIIRADRLHPP
ncbi:hypothetical protein KZ774_23720 [Escherichia coli]|nr:hypothetical protein [Escherichia coli]